MARRYIQGLFTPKHPEKYVGDITKIRYMSGWELYVHEFMDNNPNVLRWASEPIAIHYFNPVKQKLCKYFPDYWVEFRKENGETFQEILEVKPNNQTRPPRKNAKWRLQESATYMINNAKWQAAIQFCKEKGIEFRIITEKSLFR